MGLRILHIAPFNIAGVPITFVNAERKLGHYSRLVTLGKDARNYEEDICLELPFLNFWGTQLAKHLVSNPSKLFINNVSKVPLAKPLYWQPNGRAEAMLVSFREWLWRGRLNRFFEENAFWEFDVYQLDGGLEFFRDGRIARRLRELGKKIICCYTGSDLRTRGAIREIDAVSDLNVTLEFDHLKLHKNIHHVFFPFSVDGYDVRPEPDSATIKIGHAPTNRQAKGSDDIIAAVHQLQNEHPVELVLIENLPHKEALRRKSQCHIFVDQIGDLGYGINSLESLAMGIPTCSCLAPGFEEKYPLHPFVVIDRNNIKLKLVELVKSKELRKQKGEYGRAWVQRYHDSQQVVKTIHKLANLSGDGC